LNEFPVFLQFLAAVFVFTTPATTPAE